MKFRDCLHTWRSASSWSSSASIAISSIVAALFFAAPVRANVIYGTSPSSAGGPSIVAYNTQTQATTTIPTDLNQPYGIAYGPNGDLYVVDRDRTGNESTQNIEIYSTSGTDLGTFATGMPYNGLSAGLTFDKAGNLYAGISNAGTGAVEEFFAGGGSTVLPGSFVFPGQLNVDSANDLFVTDIGTNKVYEYGPSRTTPALFATQSNGVGGVAADAAGNVYLSTDSPFDIYRYTAGGVLTGNPFSNVGGFGLVYSPGTDSMFGVDAPSLYQYDLANSNPSTNGSSVSAIFDGTEYLTVQVIPEPASAVLLLIGGGVLIGAARRKRRSQS